LKLPVDIVQVFGGPQGSRSLTLQDVNPGSEMLSV